MAALDRVWTTEKMNMNLGDKPERNRRIVRMHTEDKLTFKEIATIEDLTAERIRQIVRRAGVSVDVSRRVRTLVGRVEFVCERCGCTKLLWPSDAKRQRFCSYDCFMASGEPGRQVQKQYSDAELLDHLRAISDSVNHTPTVLDVIDHSPPCHVTYFRRFGSFQKAQRMAGFDPNPVGFHGHQL